jgi:hypothetical protein
MREFPSKFVPSNLSLFPQIKYDRDICYLREAIYEWFIQEKPLNKEETKYPQKGFAIERKELDPFESPFDLDGFRQRRNPPNFEKMIQQVQSELSKEWSTKIGYNGTSLWIYPPDKKPKSIPDWE